MAKNIQANNLAYQFHRFIKERNLQQHRLGVAVSGGIDSVVLCALCHESDLNFFIVHCNFQLRGEESDRDEAFVKSLSEKYGIDVLVQKFETEFYAEENKLSIQEAARKLRYDWFEQLHKEKKADFILLGQHANDNVETILMNFFRGTGLDGLTGMPEFKPHGHCLRPLLHNTRNEIEQFAQEKELLWVEDSSNQLSKYTRNFFRHEIIPAIKKVYPQVEDNLIKNIGRFQQINTLYQLSVQNLKEKICEGKLPEVRIPVKKLMQYQRTSLIYEIIKDFGFEEKQVEEVIKLASSESGKFIANESYQLIKHRAWFIISPVFMPAQTIAIDKEDKEVSFANGRLEFKQTEMKKFQLSKAENLAQVDVSHIKFPLVLRQWKQGDYFYPLGMRKKKKLTRFFIDAKLSKNEKENVWVIESANRIIWVVGHRIDDRFKITSGTQKVLEITLSLKA